MADLGSHTDIICASVPHSEDPTADAASVAPTGVPPTSVRALRRGPASGCPSATCRRRTTLVQLVLASMVIARLERTRSVRSCVDEKRRELPVNEKSRTLAISPPTATRSPRPQTDPPIHLPPFAFLGSELMVETPLQLLESGRRQYMDRRSGFSASSRSNSFVALGIRHRAGCHVHRGRTDWTAKFAGAVTVWGWAGPEFTQLPVFPAIGTTNRNRLLHHLGGHTPV